LQQNNRVLGIDTGGTFTDFVYYNQGHLSIHKVLSTPEAPEKAILQGIAEMGLEQQLKDLWIVHGSTVATNAVLEKKGVKTVYIANKGLADVLTIGRQARKELYNLKPEPQQPPVPKAFCLEVDCRVDARGQRLKTLSSNELESLLESLKEMQPDAIAINLLFSFLDDSDEKLIEKTIRREFPDVFISRSSVVLPEYKEYERGIATWLNAWIGPLVHGYIKRLMNGVSPAQVAVMQSSGGTIAASGVADHAVRMLLSGPAGGLAGAKFIAELMTSEQYAASSLLTFDMGGTSTDVAVIEGELQLTSEGQIDDYPVAIPMVDMHTIGAGGGSIASVDAGGILKVGPQSAGARPGPACYQQDGIQPTVTDANLILGRLMATSFLGGEMTLDIEAAVNAVRPLAEKLSLSVEETASGIIQLANEHMSRALRVMSIQRGIDPQELMLMPFGGAGGLHVCALADNLGMKQALVPVHAGVLSALGMVVAPHSRDLSHTINSMLESIDESSIMQPLETLAEQGRKELLAEGIAKENIAVFFSVDLRYKGQSYTLNVPWEGSESSIKKFHQLHKKRYGHQHQQPIELVNIRVKASAPALHIELPQLPVAELPVAEQPPQTDQSPPIKTETALFGIAGKVPVYQREQLCFGHRLSGPALIVEQVATTWVAEHWHVQVDKYGNLLLKKS
jgi:N-methylhydantoinase A